MPNKNALFAGNKPQAHLGRNGFDGSAARIFTMRPAVVRPVFFQHTVPNSSYRITANDIVRASALQTAAFLRGKHELDFYFIPYSQIQSNADDIILQRGDTPTLAAQLSPKFHLANLQYLVYWAALPYAFQRFVSWIKAQQGYNPAALIQHIQDDFLHYLLNVDPSQTVSYGWLNCFYYDEVSSADSVRFLDNFNFVGSDVLSLLSSLGYGDHYLALKTIFDNVIYARYSLNDSDIVASKILDYLRYYIDELSVGTFSTQTCDFKSDSRSVNLIPLFSYQKVWYDYYRDSVNDDSGIYEYAFTGDLIFFQYSPTNFATRFNASDNPLLTYLRPRRRMYKRDLATGLYASPQYGESSRLPLNDIQISNNYVMSGGIDTAASARIGTASQNGTLRRGDDANTSSWSIINTPSAYDIKYTFALQKFRETLLRAGNRTKDVLLAEFGVRSEYVANHLPKYLGSFSGSLDLNKVAATSDAGDYSVGDLGGNIFSSLQGSTIDFTCNDYGIVIGFMSFVTDPLHNNYGVDAMNIKSEGMDFYHEEFANLGLQPVSSERFSLLYDDGNMTTPKAYTLGFAARDIEYKQNTDFVQDNFCSAPLISDRIIEEFEHDFQESFVYEDGSNTNYVSVKNLRQTLSMSKQRSYLLPDCMDSIFTSLDNGTVENAHFDVCLAVSMTEVLPMPVTGLM